MEETIHINLRGYTTDTHHIGTYTVKIWSHLLATVHWIFKNPIPGNILIQHGISMTVITNLAMAVEGLVADICWNYIHDQEHLKVQLNVDLDKNGWKFKKELYNNLFKKKLEDYNGFDGISALLNFRNNLAHGRTYTEFSKREISGNNLTEIEAENKVYQNFRDYLIAKGILKSANISSNVEVPWKIETACHFAGLVKFFLQNVLTENESNNNSAIKAEFKLAFDLQ